MKRRRRAPNPCEELEHSGLLDRSERPTSHVLFAPMEGQKEREEARLRAKVRRKGCRS
jgi:hypothetical protein